MSHFSSRSGWTETSSRAPGGDSRVRERRLPNTGAIKALVYLAGRDPHKVKGVRVYRTTWSAGSDDGVSDTSSNSSFWSSSSSGGGRQPKNEIYFLETRGLYPYYIENDGGDWTSGDASTLRNRNNHRSNNNKKKRTPPHTRRGTGGKRRDSFSDEGSVDSDDESGSSDASLGDYDDVPGFAGGGGAFGFPPGMGMAGMAGMAGMGGMGGMGAPPPTGGGFMYGGGPPPQHPSYTPRPMTGFSGGGMPPPPPPPQPGFSQGRGGVQVFGMDP